MECEERALMALLAGDARLAAEELVYAEQWSLRMLRAIAKGLLDLSPEQCRLWLETPNIRLGGETPASNLRQGDPNAWQRVSKIFAKRIDFNVIYTGTS